MPAPASRSPFTIPSRVVARAPVSAPREPVAARLELASRRVPAPLSVAAERELSEATRPIVRALLAVLSRSDDTVRRSPSPRET